MLVVCMLAWSFRFARVLASSDTAGSQRFYTLKSQHFGQEIKSRPGQIIQILDFKTDCTTRKIESLQVHRNFI